MYDGAFCSPAAIISMSFPVPIYLVRADGILVPHMAQGAKQGLWPLPRPAPAATAYLQVFTISGSDVQSSGHTDRRFGASPLSTALWFTCRLSSKRWCAEYPAARSATGQLDVRRQRAFCSCVPTHSVAHCTVTKLSGMSLVYLGPHMCAYPPPPPHPKTQTLKPPSQGLDATDPSIGFKTLTTCTYWHGVGEQQFFNLVLTKFQHTSLVVVASGKYPSHKRFVLNLRLEPNSVLPQQCQAHTQHNIKVCTYAGARQLLSTFPLSQWQLLHLSCTWLRVTPPRNSQGHQSCMMPLMALDISVWRNS